MRTLLLTPLGHVTAEDGDNVIVAGASTVSVASPFTPSTVARIVAVPPPTPVAVAVRAPVDETVATLVFKLAHETV